VSLCAFSCADHYGDSDFRATKNKNIKTAIPFFAGVVVVNHKLKI
jgi:hypothetical protein